MRKKWTYVAIVSMMLGVAPVFTGCVDTDEPAGIENLRGAKAELLKAKAELELAKIELVKAQAAHELANANRQQADADYRKAEEEYYRAKTEHEKHGTDNGNDARATAFSDGSGTFDVACTGRCPHNA